MKVVLLIDKKNSWIKKFAIEFKKKYISKKYKIILTEKQTNIKNSIVFLLGFTNIVDQNFLKKNIITLVIHESNLPKGKGFSPVQWQVLKNKNKIPATLFKATKNLDCGNVILKDNFKINATDLNEEIRISQANITFKLIKRFLKIYPKYKEIPQKNNSTYFRRRSKEDSKIDLKKSLKSQINLLRIVDNENYPAFFYYKGKKFILKIYKNK